MVKITKGNSVLKVTGGAYMSVYKPQGWRLVDEPIVQAEKVVAPSQPELIEDAASLELDVPDLEPEEEVEVAEEVGEEDLSEKPLKEMSFDELKAYAQQLNIDIEELDSKKKLREAIRQVL